LQPTASYTQRIRLIDITVGFDYATFVKTANTEKCLRRRQILKSVYEDNLLHVIRGERRRDIARQGENTRKNHLLPAMLMVLTGIAVVYATNPISRVDGLALSQQALLEYVDTSTSSMAVESNLTFTLADTTDFQDWDWSAQPLAFPEVEPFGTNDVQLLHTPNFSLASLFGLGVKTIVIDPGHGGKDSGAVGGLGTYEKDLALKLALLLKQRLEQRGGYRILLTRATDKSMSLQKRVKFANGNHADLFISIHLNAFPKPNVNFVETYYFGASTDTEISRLAARENEHSDYQYAEFRRLIQRIGDTLKFQESKKLAAHVQHNLYKNIKQLNGSASDHGIKPGPFVVLLGLNAPSILIEVANLTNEREENRLNTVDYQDKVAGFLEYGIVSYLNSKETTGGREHGKEKELVQARETAETRQYTASGR